MLAALRAHRLAVPLARLAMLAASGPRFAGAGQYAIHIDHEITAGTVRRVLDGARERLAEPRCQQVLDDFADGEGRPLRARLEETGRTPQDYLGLVVFYDGRKHPRCGQKGILAVAQPGSRVVWVCPDELYTTAGRDPVWAEAALIHEALHTLGLNENPPSSREITSQVIRRCRR
jgi:hypothetical protein